MFVMSADRDSIYDHGGAVEKQSHRHVRHRLCLWSQHCGCLPPTLVSVYQEGENADADQCCFRKLILYVNMRVCRSMLPDVVDDFKVLNPESQGHEAIFYSFYVFFTKFASGVSLGISTLSLE